MLTGAAIPRSGLMLLSGALLDRLPPRLVPLGASLVRGGAVGLVGLLALGDLLRLWQVFLLAVTLGVADAFFFPAALALTARLVDAPGWPRPTPWSRGPTASPTSSARPAPAS